MRRMKTGHAEDARPRRLSVCAWGKSGGFFFFDLDLLFFCLGLAGRAGSAQLPKESAQ